MPGDDGFPALVCCTNLHGMKDGEAVPLLAMNSRSETDRWKQTVHCLMLSSIRTRLRTTTRYLLRLVSETSTYVAC